MQQALVTGCPAVCPKVCRVGLALICLRRALHLEAVSVRVGGERGVFLFFLKRGEEKNEVLFGWQKKYSLKNFGCGWGCAVFKSVFFCALPVFVFVVLEIQERERRIIKWIDINEKHCRRSIKWEGNITDWIGNFVKQEMRSIKHDGNFVNGIVKNMEQEQNFINSDARK